MSYEPDHLRIVTSYLQRIRQARAERRDRRQAQDRRRQDAGMAAVDGLNRRQRARRRGRDRRRTKTYTPS